MGAIWIISKQKCVTFARKTQNSPITKRKAIFFYSYSKKGKYEKSVIKRDKTQKRAKKMR